jgi:hypothetical protein
MARDGFALQRKGAFRRPAKRRALRLVASLLAPMLTVAALGGCADISRKFADTASQLPAVGLPADAPERPAQPAPYPAVHDIPPPRNSVTLTNFEQQQLEDDLVAARDHQQTLAGVPLQPKKKSKDSPQTVVPVSSRASIY